MSEATPEPKVQGQMFDEHLVELFRPTIEQAFLQHGDVLRSVGLFFDYHGALNDAAISKGMWLGPNGAVLDPPAIIGSALSSLRMLEMILQRGFDLTQQLELQIRQQIGNLTEMMQHASQTPSDAPADAGQEKEATAQLQPDGAGSA